MPVLLRKARSGVRLAGIRAQEAQDYVLHREPVAALRHRLSGNVNGPVFIVGNGRSGTSIMRNSVRHALDWSGHGEGHLLPLARDLIRAVGDYHDTHPMAAGHPRHLIHHIRPHGMRRRLARFVREEYLRVYGNTRFVDKTPGPQAMLALTQIQHAFPDMRVIFCHRRAIEVLRSAERKFPKTSFQEQCDIWQAGMHAWHDMRGALKVPYLEVEQRDLDMRPEVVTQQLSDLLRLRPRQSRTLLERFQTDRPQSSGDLNAGRIDLFSNGWSKARIAAFRKTCGPMMEAFGYSERPDYFAGPADRD